MTVVRPVLPLFGSPVLVAESARQLSVERIDLETAMDANWHWHSVLPDTRRGNILGAGDLSLGFGAVFDNGLYGVAIWTRAIAANRMRRPTGHMLELRRLAIPSYSPKYTATRMLGQMARYIRRGYEEICTLISYQATDVHKGTIYKAANWSATYSRPRHLSWTHHTGYAAKYDQQNASRKVRWEYRLRDCRCDA